MSRYIDADALKEKLTPEALFVRGIYHSWTIKVKMIEAVLKLIDEQPAADVQEVRHGAWINEKSMCNIGERWNYCSYCGYPSTEIHKQMYTYCPACGTRMDGKDE